MKGGMKAEREERKEERREEEDEKRTRRRKVDASGSDFRGQRQCLMLLATRFEARH